GALAWAVLVHVAYDLERLFPETFQHLTRFLDQGPLLAGAWVVPPGSAPVPVTLRSLFVRGFSPEELFAFDQRLPERGPEVFARYHTRSVVVAASRVRGIQSRARAFYDEAPGLGWPPSKIGQIRKAVEAVAALYNPQRVHWFEAEVRGPGEHVLAWPDAFAADVVEFLVRRERALGIPGLVQNYLLTAMLEFKTGLSEFERLEIVGVLVGQAPAAAREALTRALADFTAEKVRAAPTESPAAIPATPARSERRSLAQWVYAWTGAVQATAFPPLDARGRPGVQEFDFAEALGEKFERPLELDLDHPVDPAIVAHLVASAIEAENEFFQNVTGELQRALTELYRWHAGVRGVTLYLYVDIAHHQVLIFSPVRSTDKSPGELRPEIRAISFAAGDPVREFTPTRPPANSILFSLARAGGLPSFGWRRLDPDREMAEWKVGVLGLALEIPLLLLAATTAPSPVFHVGLGLFALAHVALEARSGRLGGRSRSAAWATALSQLPARVIALAPYALVPGSPDAAHALAAVLVHLGFDFSVFGRPHLPHDPRDRTFDRGLRFPYDEESLSHRFGSFHLSARDRFIGRDGRPGTIYSISLLAFPDPNSEVGRRIDALAADFLRQPFAAAFFPTPPAHRHLTLRPYSVSPAAPASDADWTRIAAAAAADVARTPPYLYLVRDVGIDPNSGRVGVWVDDRERSDGTRGSIALFSPRRPLAPAELQALRAWVLRHRFDVFGEWNVSELSLVQGDDSYFIARRREKTLTLSGISAAAPSADQPPPLRRLKVRLWAPLPAKALAGGGTGADIIVRPVSQTERMVKSYGKALDRIPAPLAARLEGVRSAMILGPGANADEIELLWRRLPHVREIHLVEVVADYIKAQDDFLVQHPDWAVNADGDPIAYYAWRAPMGALPVELNESMDFLFDHQVLDFGYLGRLGMETVARSLNRVLRPSGLHVSFVFGSEPAMDEYLGPALFRDETLALALRGPPSVPALPKVPPAGVSSQAEDFLNLVRATPAPGAVLSLGFGAGDDERYLARQLPDRRGIATTVREGELRAARTRTDTPANLVYIHEDMRRGFDAAVGSIQHVYARLTLHHLARQELPGVVREITRVLEPGGILFLVVKGERDPWALHPSARRNPANELTSYVDRGQTIHRRFASAAEWTREFSDFDYEPLRPPVETFERLAGDDHDSHLITLAFRRRAAGREVRIFSSNGWEVWGAADTGPAAQGIRTPAGVFSELKIMRGGSQIGSIKGNGYYRLTPPGTVWGTSFVTPGYWTDGRYYHNAAITDLAFSNEAAGPLVLTGRLDAPHIAADDFTITCRDTDPAERVEIGVAFTLKAKTDFALEGSRVQNGEALKVFQFSSMNIGAEWDADRMAAGGVDGALAIADGLVFPRPETLGRGGEVILTNDLPQRVRETPTTYVRVMSAPSDVVAQGWVARSNDVNDDNVGGWLGIVPPGMGDRAVAALGGVFKKGQSLGFVELVAGARPPSTARVAVPEAIDEGAYNDARSDLERMKGFVRAYLKANGYRVREEGWLSGLAPHYCAPKEPNRPYADLRRELSPDNLRRLDALEPIGEGHPFNALARGLAGVLWGTWWVPVIAAGGLDGATVSWMGPVLWAAISYSLLVAASNVLDGALAGLARALAPRTGEPDDDLRQKAKARLGLLDDNHLRIVPQAQMNRLGKVGRWKMFSRSYYGLTIIDEKGRPEATYLADWLFRPARGRLLERLRDRVLRNVLDREKERRSPSALRRHAIAIDLRRPFRFLTAPVAGSRRRTARAAAAAMAFLAGGATAQPAIDPDLNLAPLAASARSVVDAGLVKSPEGKTAVERFERFLAAGGAGTVRVGNFASLPVRFLEELDRLNDGLAKDQLMVLTRGSAGNTTVTPLRRVGPSSLSDQVLRVTNIPAETQARGVGGEGGYTVRRLSLIYADRLELKAQNVRDVLQWPKGRRNLALPGWDVLIDRQFPMGSAIVSLDAVRSSFEARWVIHEWLHRVGGKERDALLGEFIIAPWLQVTTLEVGLIAYLGGPGAEAEPARVAAREVFRLLEKELVPGREPLLTPASTLQTLTSRGDLDLRRAAIRAWVKASGRPFFTSDTLALARKAGLSSDVLASLQAEEKSALPEGTARRAQYENALAKEHLGWLTAQGDSPTARRYLRAVAANAPLGPDAPLTADTVVQLLRRIRAREVDSTFNNALAPLAAERKKLPASSPAAAAHDRGTALATTLLDNL
ncbi:MAG TPA: class I SAM-dependent methyltransferase, partial [Elusimicrobiota bacterium]|nr:class I SAM-dependent methyltransferase [Elusimicrobiota bacterium]